MSEPSHRQHPLMRLLKGDITTVMIGNLVRSGFRWLAALLVMSLGKEQFGLFYLSMQWFGVGSQAADLGLDTAGVRYASRYRREGKADEEHTLFRLLLVAKIWLALSAVFIGILLAGWLGPKLAGPEAVLPIRIAVFGILGRALINYLSVFFKSRQDFIRNAVTVALGPLFIMLGMAFLWITKNLTVSSALLVYALAPVLAFLILYLSPWFRLRPRSPHVSRWGMFSRLVRFGKYVFVTNVASAVRTRLMAFLIPLWATRADLGLYGAGDYVANVLSLVSASILTTLVPKASSRINADEIRSFLAKNVKRSFLLTLPFFAVIPFVGPVVRLLAQWLSIVAEYQDAVPIMNLIYAGVLFSIIILPVRSVLYAIRRPHVETVVEIVMVALVITLGLILLPRYGIMGAAAVMFIQRLLTCLILLTYAYIKIYKDPNLAESMEEIPVTQPPNGDAV
ncbi:oligosaccharide flippase family protein [Acidobacteriota bacterium]